MSFHWRFPTYIPVFAILIPHYKRKQLGQSWRTWRFLVAPQRETRIPANYQVT